MKNCNPCRAAIILSAVVTLFAAAASAQTFTVLHSFTGSPDGANPIAPVLIDGAGNLYGTTFFGGSLTNGTIYKIDRAGNETIELNFDFIPGGGFPGGALIMDAKGDIYGTAEEGKGGAGVAYELTHGGKERVLFSFQGGLNNQNPKSPDGGFAMDAAGNLYGTTIGGGISACSRSGDPYCGTIFKLTQEGKLTVLHNFTGKSDGGAPMSTLIMDAAGDLYGTTYVGGDLNCMLQGQQGCGVIFKLDSTGTFSVLHAFHGGADGAFPLGGGAGLTVDAAGNFYGSAGYAGTFGGQCGIYGCGTIFKIDATGTFSVLHSFSSNGTEGETPNAGLAIDSEGNLYGTAQTGGANANNNFGTIFEVSPAGKLTALYSFTGLADGANPFAGLFRDSQGNLYGTTYQAFGFHYQDGAVFKFTP
jgi:uncharacterized repeat protein (TIGR03803 family)